MAQSPPGPPAQPPAPRSSPLALTVLALLHYQPLHPYGIQRLIKQWGKDQVVNVEQRTSLYRTIERLLAAGLIAVRETGRDPRYPERTVYEVTEAGRQTARRWLEEMLAEPRQEYPEFPAALSHVLMLEPAELAEVLERRRPGPAHRPLRIPVPGPGRPGAGRGVPARHRGPAAGPVALPRAAAGPRARAGGEPRRGDDAADRAAASRPGARCAEPADEGRRADPDRHVQGARRRGGRLPGRRARGFRRGHADQR